MKRFYVPLLIMVGLGFVLSWMMRGPVGQNRRLSSCQSNLKKIGLAALQYVRDYDERYVIVTRWQDDLAPYHGKPELMKCTEFPFGYSMSRYYSGLRMTDDNSPATSPMVFDSTTQQKNGFDTGTSWPANGAHKQWQRQESLRWQPEGGNNVCYADGHVRWEKKKPLFKVLGPTFPPLPATRKQKLKLKSKNKKSGSGLMSDTM